MFDFKKLLEDSLPNIVGTVIGAGVLALIGLIFSWIDLIWFTLWFNLIGLGFGLLIVFGVIVISKHLSSNQESINLLDRIVQIKKGHLILIFTGLAGTSYFWNINNPAKWARIITCVSLLLLFLILVYSIILLLKLNINEQTRIKIARVATIIIGFIIVIIFIFWNSAKVFCCINTQTPTITGTPPTPTITGTLPTPTITGTPPTPTITGTPPTPTITGTPPTPTITPTRDPSKITLAITEIYADTCLDTDAEKYFEYIEIYNYGLNDVPIDGLILFSSTYNARSQRIISWETGAPSQKLDSNLITNSSVIPPKGYALILSKLYKAGLEAGYKNNFDFFEGTIILTIEDGYYLGRNGLFGLYPPETISELAIVDSLTNKVISSYGAPKLLLSADPPYILADTSDGFPKRILDCQVAERIDPSWDDLSQSWRISTHSPGWGY